MLAKFKGALAGRANKVSGRTDFLEAVSAAAALVAYADGSASDAEVDATVKAVSANAVLSQAFRTNVIESTVDKMLKRAEGGRVGRNGLYKEIDDIQNDHELSETVLLTALDIAEAGDGHIDDKEKAVLQNIAGRLGLKLESYL